MSDRSRILTQIADALAVPVETLTNVDDGSDDRVAPLSECIELLKAFWHIGDRQARRRCLSYVKTAAARSADGT